MISATIIGRLTRDPEQQQVGQYNVTRFTVASNSTRKNREGEYDNTFVRYGVWTAGRCDCPTLPERPANYC